MQREFASRDELFAYLREQFPTATERDDHISETVGGRDRSPDGITKGRSSRLCEITQLFHWCGNAAIALHPLRRPEFS